MVEMKSTYRKQHLAQIWDEMRRKINDMRRQLPPGVEEPMIIDEFGDVFGMFLAITGEGYNYDELADYTDHLRRELVLCLVSVKSISEAAGSNRSSSKWIAQNWLQPGIR